MCLVSWGHFIVSESFGDVPLVLGIGCRRGVSADDIDTAIMAVLNGTALAQVRAVATLDRKAREPGLVDFCARHGLPLVSFPAAQIDAAAATDSARVRALAGVGGVCEPCALLASREGRIVVEKTIVGDVTVAVAADRNLSSSVEKSA
jgi:cobalt-precorrin 5A hydrolase